MSLPKPDLHVRLIPEAKATLRLLAESRQIPESVLAGQLLQKSLLGEGYVLKVAARNLQRAGIDGSDWE